MIIRNIEIVTLVANRLGDLNSQVVYLGGATTALMVPEGFRGAIRQTKDVDIIVDVGAIGDYHRLVEKIRSKGFTEDTGADAPICRYRATDMPDLLLDIMPTDPNILGFSNRWYPQALITAEPRNIAGEAIRLVIPGYFLATKFEAWLGRGNGDIFAHDMEDIVFVLEHRPTIAEELEHAPLELKTYLGERSAHLLATQVEYYLEGMTDSRAGTRNVLNNLIRIRQFARN